MINISFTGNLRRLAAKDLIAARKKFLKDNFKIACQKYLKEAVQTVPSYSGMALGTFLPLAKDLQLVGFVRALISVNPKSKLNWKRNRKTGQVFIGKKKRNLKTVAKGSANGRGSYFDKENMEMVINMKTLHLAINAYYNISDMYPEYFGWLKSPTPWNTFAVGRKAYQDHINSIRNKMPSIKRFTTTVKIGT